MLETIKADTATDAAVAQIFHAAAEMKDLGNRELGTTRTESPPPVALPVGAAEYAESVDCDNLLDPDTVNPKREPGLCPPLAGDDPWVKVRQEALAQGDMDMARKIVAPVIYEPGHQPHWEGLHLPVIKELKKSTNEGGLKNSLTTGVLEAIVHGCTQHSHPLT